MTDRPPPTIIYLVRHGETEWNAEGRCQGRADADFTEAGRRQLRSVAAELANVPVDAAYTSPLPRAVRTADAILGGRSLRARRVDELSEISYGSLQGTRFVDWPPALHDTWRSDPWSVTFPDGESLEMVAARVLPAFAMIVAAHPGETVLVSAHGHVNRLILATRNGHPPTAFWAIDQVNGSAQRLECHPGRTP